jgi:HD-like signal output (HDOD) protein
MKKSIYIVDDQEEVLEIAVLIVRSVMPDAEVTGFTKPKEALAAIHAKPPDLVLSDQLMPGMHGSELLEAVRVASPSTVRIIMSGYVALDKLTVITSAHQYVAKPFDVMELKELLQRTFSAQERIRDEGLRTVVTSLRSLPSLPQVQHSLLAVLRDSHEANTVIGNIIAQDAGLTAKVLQLANSPLFGHDYLVTSPADAVTCLGTSIIAAVVLSQSLFKHYSSNLHPEMDLRRVWDHCWETAGLAQLFCREKGLPRVTCEAAFLAGLLHETGRLILVDNFPERFQAACDAAREGNAPLTLCLRKVFQASPAEIAAYLLDLWGLPAAVVNGITFFEQPEKEKTGEFSPASALYIADQIASRRSPPDPFPPVEWNASYLRSIGGPEELAAWERTGGSQKS